jgi:hypothetical protein
MHVYQYRTWRWHPIKMIGKEALAFGDYHYCSLVPDRTIIGYSMEEQAEMVQDPCSYRVTETRSGR